MWTIGIRQKSHSRIDDALFLIISVCIWQFLVKKKEEQNKQFFYEENELSKNALPNDDSFTMSGDSFSFLLFDGSFYECVSPDFIFYFNFKCN